MSPVIWEIWLIWASVSGGASSTMRWIYFAVLVAQPATHRRGLLHVVWLAMRLTDPVRVWKPIWSMDPGKARSALRTQRGSRASSPAAERCLAEATLCRALFPAQARPGANRQG